MVDAARSNGDVGLNWHRSLWMQFLDRTNVIVSSLTAFFVLYSRSVGVAYFTLGAVVCSIVVKLLKRVLRQPRPPPSVSRKIKKSYGMPSTHSATITFFATYILLASIYLPVHPSFLMSRLSIRWVAPLVSVPWAAVVICSRIWLGHHTWPQVVVGISCGVALAGVWFQLWVERLDVCGNELEEMGIAFIDKLF